MTVMWVSNLIAFSRSGEKKLLLYYWEEAKKQRDILDVSTRIYRRKLETPAVAMYFYKCIHLLQGRLIFLAKFNVYFETWYATQQPCLEN